MIEALPLVAGLAVCAVALLNLIFSAEILAGGTAPTRFDESEREIETVVVIPANNESAVIGNTLANLADQLDGERRRALVVADNCTDNTAEIARMHGVDVIVRHDLTKIGKGHALAAACRYLSANPPDVVLVLDADCELQCGGVARLSTRAMNTHRPVQGISLLRPNLQAAPLVQVSNFAFAVKNQLRNVGLCRITGSALLNGTGMALPWDLYSGSPLSSSCEVEDLELGLFFTRIGAAPLTAPDVLIWSESSGVTGTLLQRTRWERGFLRISVSHALPTLARAIFTLRPRLIWFGLDLMVPPLSLLAFFNGVVALIALATLFLTGEHWPLTVIGISGLLAIISVIFAWRRVGRPFLTGRVAASIPLYAAWKLPLYLRSFLRAPSGWLRTGRPTIEPARKEPSKPQSEHRV